MESKSEFEIWSSGPLPPDAIAISANSTTLPLLPLSTHDVILNAHAAQLAQYRPQGIYNVLGLPISQKLMQSRNMATKCMYVPPIRKHSSFAQPPTPANS